MASPPRGHPEAGRCVFLVWDPAPSPGTPGRVRFCGNDYEILPWALGGRQCPASQGGPVWRGRPLLESGQPPRRKGEPMSRLLRLEPPLAPQIVKRAYVLGLGALALLLVAGVYGGVVGCIDGLHSSAPGAVAAPLAASAAYVVGIGLAAVV